MFGGRSSATTTTGSQSHGHKQKSDGSLSRVGHGRTCDDTVVLGTGGDGQGASGPAADHTVKAVASPSGVPEWLTPKAIKGRTAFWSTRAVVRGCWGRRCRRRRLVRVKGGTVVRRQVGLTLKGVPRRARGWWTAGVRAMQADQLYPGMQVDPDEGRTDADDRSLSSTMTATHGEEVKLGPSTPR